MQDANRYTGQYSNVDPLGDGNVPGQAFIPNSRFAKLDAGRSCVKPARSAEAKPTHRSSTAYY
jgi:hypothetical protein